MNEDKNTNEHQTAAPVRRFLQRKLIKYVAALAVIAIFAAGIWFFFSNREPSVTSTYLGSKLSKVGELTTVKLDYTGIVDYKDAGLPILNRSDFLMLFDASARVGIDLSKVVVNVDESEQIVWLTIPKAQIQDVKIDASSIEYRDEKFSLFNSDEKEDGNQAIVLAEERAREDIAQMGVLESADEQAFLLIKGLLQDAVPSEYTIKVKED